MYWVNRAILCSEKYRGTCVRKIMIDPNELEKQIEYYKPGKIFRFQNIISAWIPKTSNDLQAELYNDDSRNVTFYIYSTNGAQIYNYLGNYSYQEKGTGRTVLFNSGSEFLVCKVEKDGDEKYNIYLRNITLGFTNNQTILWTDDSCGSNKFINLNRMLNYRTQFRTEQKDQDFQVIFKSNSLFSRAYMDSAYFLISLALSNTFTFI